MSEEFTGLQINLIHIESRKQDAHRLAVRLEAKGAMVHSFEVTENFDRKNVGIIYYFDKSNEPISTMITELVADIEIVVPQFHRSQKTNSALYSVWIVRKPKVSNVVSSKSLKPIPSRPMSSGLRQGKSIKRADNKIIKVIRCYCGRPVIRGSDTCYDHHSK